MVADTLLLDTSALYWAVADPSRLSRRAREALANRKLIASVVCYWELSIKSGRAGIALGNPAVWWEKAIEQLRAEVLPIRADHVTVLHGLPDHHRDPFDRIIAAQAISEGYVLVTSDAILQKYPVRFIW